MSLGNLAAKRAEKESQWWERLLVASEPRTASRGRVSATEDSYYVFGAGTEVANGLYVRNGNSDGVPAYSIFVESVAVGSIWRDGSQWWMTGGDVGDYTLSYYYVDGADQTRRRRLDGRLKTVKTRHH